MPPDINDMRVEVKALYPGVNWKRRVVQMPDSQIMAIYFREKQKAEKAALEKKERNDVDPF